MICYLDFDGVLHDENVIWKHGRGIFMATEGRSLFEWEPILVELLAPRPDVKIVLSTSWVRMKSFQYAKRRLCESLQSRVIGATFSKGAMDRDAFGMQSRGKQVLADVTRRQSKNWFAIDDDPEGWESCRNKLILTDEKRGLNDLAVQASIRTMLEKR